MPTLSFPNNPRYRSSGNKASLIQRLKSFEDKKTEQVRAAAAPAPAAKREASTSAAPASASASTVAAMDPDIFNIKIPDLSRPDPEIPVQVVRAILPALGP